VFIDGRKDAEFLVWRQATIAAWSGRRTPDVLYWIRRQSYTPLLDRDRVEVTEER